MLCLPIFELSLQMVGQQRAAFCCRRFLYKQIEHYLTRHVDMPPKCCVLVAILQPNEEDSGTSRCSVAISLL